MTNKPMEPGALATHNNHNERPARDGREVEELLFQALKLRYNENDRSASEYLAKQITTLPIAAGAGKAEGWRDMKSAPYGKWILVADGCGVGSWQACWDAALQSRTKPEGMDIEKLAESTKRLKCTKQSGCREIAHEVHNEAIEACVKVLTPKE